MSRLEQLFGIDHRSLAAFRIGLASILLADLAYRSLDFEAHYTDRGVLPRALYLEIFSNVEIAWSVNLLFGSSIFTAFLFLLAASSALSILFRVHTRWAVLISWLLLVSLHNRQPSVISGSDMILRLLLFWSLFLPLGGPPKREREPVTPVPAKVEVSPASAALLLQVMLIYLFSFVHKLQDPAWTQLIAVE